METLKGFPNPRHLPPALPPPRYARPRAMVRSEQSSAAPHAFEHAYLPGKLSALSTVCRINVAMVMGPTPPGTGV